MIQLILSLLIGALLLLSLASFAFRRRAEGSSVELVEARQALNALQGGLLPAELVARIFDRTDLEYVNTQPSPEVRELFLKERKRVALLWIGRVRKQIARLKSFHLGSARFYAGLNLRTELSLALDFGRLIFACRMLEVFVQVRGPYAAPGIVGATAAAAAKVCSVSQESIAFLTPVYAAGAPDGSAQPGPRISN